jgi:hypothetical protein
LFAASTQGACGTGAVHFSSLDVLAMPEGANAARMDSGSGPLQDAAPTAFNSAQHLFPILLVALAIFLIVLILARSPLQGYVVSQRVQAASDRVSDAPPLATEQVVAWLKSDAVLASTVQQVCPRDSLAAQNNVIQELRSRLDVRPQTGPATRAGWQLNLQHRDRQLASLLLARLSDSLTAQLKHLDQAEAQLLVQHYQKVLAQAREEEDAARISLERARHEQLALVMQPTRPARGSSVAMSPAVSSARSELEQQIIRAQAKLDQLLTVRTPEHPQVIEAQSQLSRLQELLRSLPDESGSDNAHQNESAPTLRGPELSDAQAQAPTAQRIRLVSTGQASTVDSQVLVAQIQQLSAQWAAATARRTAAERAWSDAQQQWVRGLNATGWEASAIWTHAQLGGRVTHFQLLLAGSLALLGAIATWRLSYLAYRRGTLVSLDQLHESLPLPVLGEIPLSSDFPTKTPENWSLYLTRLTQVSLAVIIGVVLVAIWASSTDNNLSTQWTTDPLSALGQAFDLLHHRFLH